MKRFFITILFVFCAASQIAAQNSDFATEVVAYGGSFSGMLNYYKDPNAALGPPTTFCKNDRTLDPNLPETFRVKLIEPAYYLDINDKKAVVTLKPGSWIIVKFDHPVIDYPDNLYGMDFIVFGNSWFIASADKVGDETNINSLILTGSIYPGQVKVSVSSDGNNWFGFNDGPFADCNLFPTQAYQWDANNAIWTDEPMDFTKPVDPNLSWNDFANISAAQGIELYNGSGGGTAYDLQRLDNYENLATDPNSGHRYIQYVKLEGDDIGGQIDAVSDVAACGDLTHPYPLGDFNMDCRVDFKDIAEISGQWFLNDISDITANWLDCTYDCE